MRTRSSTGSNKSAGLRRLTAVLGWTRASYTLMSAFLLTILLIGYVLIPIMKITHLT